ncbi:MAG TPA: protein kinase [Thermomicrobiales bacterium]|nr:protein kinase [Thermomicrobiales bacterium]
MYAQQPERIVGAYTLHELIGSGGMGEVYRARHRALGREAAVKLRSPAAAGRPDFLARFAREARAAASLQHPHILPVWDYGEQAGVPYLVLPYLDGGTLGDRQRRGPLPPAVALGYLRQLAEALDYAHARGFVHRDVKPANLLFDAHDRLYLADFGIVKALEETTGLTQTGTGVGTPEYIAPEQAQGRADARSDLYSLGVIAYQMLAGRVPFSGRSTTEVLLQHLQAPVPLAPLRDPARGLPPGVAGVLERALAKDPAARYQSGAALVAALGAALTPDARLTATLAPGATPWPTPTPVPATPSGPLAAPTPQPAAPASRPLAWVAGGLGVLAVLVLGLAGVIALILLWPKPPAPTPAPTQVGVVVETPTALPATATIAPPTATGAPPTVTPPASTATPAPPTPAAPPPTPAPAPSPAPVAAPAAPGGGVAALNTWPTGTSSNGHVRRSYDPATGEYHIALLAEDTVAWTGDLAKQSFGDVTLAVDARRVAGPDALEYGLAFWLQPAASNDKSDAFYFFAVQAQGTVGLFRSNADGSWTKLIDFRPASAVKVGDAVNHLSVAAQGGRLTLAVNGQAVGAYAAPAGQAGLVGLVAGVPTGHGTGEAAFANLSVTPAAPASTQPLSVPAGWLVYRNTRLGFALAYPPGWRVDESQVAEGIVYIRSPQDDNVWLGIRAGGPAQAGVGVDQLRDQFYHDVIKDCDKAGIDTTRYNNYAGITFASLGATCQRGTTLWADYIGAGLRGGMEWDFELSALYQDYNGYDDHYFSPMLATLNIYANP